MVLSAKCSGVLLPLSRFHHPVLDAASDYEEPK
jgi:hypothetical protein